MKWPAKKTEKLELRLATETKRAFLARCQSEGRSASEVLRTFIDDYLARPLSQKDLKMIVRSPFTYAGLAAAVAIGGVIVLSAPPTLAEPDFAGIFKSMDRDGDGRLNATEFRGRTGAPRPSDPPKPNQGEVTLSWTLSEVDTNEDDSVSLAEFVAVSRASITRRFLALDADSDGKLTLAELQRPQAPLGDAKKGFTISGSTQGFFMKFDANHDGSITEDEFASPP
jgi:Ca2+-binding EF-hand superfamily protein